MAAVLVGYFYNKEERIITCMHFAFLVFRKLKKMSRAAVLRPALWLVFAMIGMSLLLSAVHRTFVWRTTDTAVSRDTSKAMRPTPGSPITTTTTTNTNTNTDTTTSTAPMTWKTTGFTVNIWPRPVEMKVAGEKTPLHKDFKFQTTSVSPRLARATGRASAWIASRKVEAAASGENGLKQISIILRSNNEALTSNTSYAYNMMIQGNAGSITADTVYGAMCALETFNQLLVRGKRELEYTGISIRDYPRYVHRGLMVDTGRRIFPVPLLKKVLDGMSFFKMSVMHFHISDLGRFAVESKLYPKLTSYSNGFFTQAEVKDLIEYAKDRGIRVVPEVDIPGHARGFFPLLATGDITFCNSANIQIRNDPGNVSLNTLKKLLTEMMDLFPDEMFHLGCDETGK